MMGETLGPLKSRIGNRVKHPAPKSTGGKASDAYGTITDEVWADPELCASEAHMPDCAKGDGCWGDYACFAQLIDWDNGEREIRLGYYYRPHAEGRGWRYGSQMTLTMSPGETKTLLSEVLSRADWFKPPA